MVPKCYPSSHFLKMSLRALSSALVTLVFVLLLIKIEGNPTPKEGHENVTDASSSSSTSLMELKDENQIIGCRGRPLICSRGEFPPRSMCCGDRCVDVTSDRENCGLCGVRCTFNRQCCNRLCLNTNLNLFNCGRCGRVCPFGRLCVFGSCAFEQAVPSPPPVSPVSPSRPVSPSLRPPVSVSPSPLFPPVFPPVPPAKSPQPLDYQPAMD